MNIFKLPFCYSFRTRINTLESKISFIVTFLIPSYILSYWFGSQVESFNLIFALLFLALFIMYEIGYIWNDFHTVLFELKPTMRLSNDQYLSMARSYPIHIALRFLLICFLLYFLQYLTEVNVLLFLILILLLNFSYSLHNFFRGKQNIVTIFLLMFFKYLSVPFVFVSNVNEFYQLLCFIFLVPLVRTFLFTTHSRFDFNFLHKKDVTKFRALYYLSSSLILSVLFYFNSEFKYLFIISSLLLLFYSLAVMREVFKVEK